MDRKNKALSQIVEQGVLPLYYHADAEVSVQVLKALYKAGCRAVEYTKRGKNALENFLRLRKVADTELHGLLLGAGGIKSKIDATEFVNEGADFIICPGVVKEVEVVVHKNGLLWVPGCMTTSEILEAEDLGAKLVKLFPAELLAPSYVNALREIFPDLLFMPTGGVDIPKDDVSAWFKGGASAVGLGSRLIRNDWLDAKDYSAIELSAREALETVQGMKKISSALTT